MNHNYRVSGLVKSIHDVDYVVENVIVDEDNQFTRFMDTHLKGQSNDSCYSYEDGLFTGDKMSFIKKNGLLYVAVDYQTTRMLIEDEMTDLIEYTSGQLSDGIGEGFEQRPCSILPNGDPMYISPWHVDQILQLDKVIK